MQSEVTIRPMGFARRMARPSPGGAATLTGSGFDRVLRDLASDPLVQIAGIHGSMSLATPGCTFLDPATGEAISANRAWNMVGPGGLVLPMYTAFPQIANLATAYTVGATGLTSNTLAAGTLARTLVENGGTSTHFVQHAAITLTDGASYRVRAKLYRSAGSRHAAIYWARSGQRAGYVINLTTGSMTSYSTGGGTVASPVATAVTGGWLVEFTISNAAWGGTVQSVIGLSSNGTTLDSYAGDGASGVTFDGVTIVAGTQTPLGVAEAATRAADANVWTMADALTQDEEMIVLGAQDYADGDMGISTQTWSQFASGAGATNMFRSAATSTSAGDKDSGSKTAVIIRGALPNRGVCFMHRHRRRAGDIDAGYGRALSGSPVAGGPWEANTAMRIGHSNTAGRAGYGRFACIRRKGGFTQAQIDALFYAFANGRTIPVAA